MVSKENIPFMVGVIVVIAIALFLNLVLKHSFGTSTIIGVVSGVIVGLILSKLLGE